MEKSVVEKFRIATTLRFKVATVKGKYGVYVDGKRIGVYVDGSDEIVEALMSNSDLLVEPVFRRWDGTVGTRGRVRRGQARMANLYLVTMRQENLDYQQDEQGDLWTWPAFDRLVDAIAAVDGVILFIA